MSSLVSFSFSKVLRKTVFLSTLALTAIAATSFMPSAWALFEDDDARKAILDLRKSLAATQSATTELQNQMEKVKTDNAQLRGRVETLEKQTEELLKNQKAYYQDLDSRLGHFEPRTVEVEGITGTVQPGEKKQYEDALKAFQGGQLKKADAEFNAFIRKYPASPYLPLALFWLGNTKYATQDYSGALAQLQAFVKRYQKHPRVPAALITIANCQSESGNKVAARKTLNELISSYPDSNEANQAQQALGAAK
ncbi:tol-pal system protein YbgF [Polynucleobacter sp. IMCC30063]|uniref:tol-pal system protein YbgF n=1 Tax=Polynucleobacter sp. IMCC30063 TaxID=2907298 RepID=UPI001F4603CA|nr:tol-pal system protein YbgF [Polynucleobacter sp. IMCC30063]MCE7505200.1 tol-pal system protein YbgF [Polynucleobacter sp. IMCC30063]